MDTLSNTRLTNNLVWPADALVELLRTSAEAPEPVVGRVPAQWRDFLDAFHLNGYYRRIVECVSNPVEIETRPGLRRVSVLGQGVFETDANGFVHAYLWSRRGNRFDCFLQDDTNVGVGDTPYRWTWLELFRRGFETELARRLRCDRGELDGYSRWVFRRFRRRLLVECNLRHMREVIQAALALDPLALQVARRVRLDCTARPTTLREYNHAVAHLPAYRKLQRESPNLVPLYALFADDLASLGEGEPAQLLKRHLADDHGVYQPIWSLVHRMRPRWLYLLRHFYAGSARDAALDLLHLLQQMGCRRAPPPWFLWNVLQVFGHPGNRHGQYWTSWAPRTRALRRLTMLVDDADAARLAEMRDGIYEVLAWIVDEDAHLRRGVARAGWRWFVRNAAAWRRHKEKLAASAPVQWPVPFDAWRDGQYVAAVLADSRQLLDEGRAMSHCVDRYTWRCAKGRHLILSIRSDGRERPVATASLAWTGAQWTVALVAGAANSAPRPVAVRLAADACARVNALGWKPPVPDANAPRVAPPPGEFDFESLPDDMDAFLEAVWRESAAAATEEEETE